MVSSPLVIAACIALTAACVPRAVSSASPITVASRSSIPSATSSSTRAAFEINPAISRRTARNGLRGITARMIRPMIPPTKASTTRSRAP